MGFFYSPKIVTDGLVFYIDAQNINSYSISDEKGYNLTKQELNGDFKYLNFLMNSDAGPPPPSASTVTEIDISTDGYIKSFSFDGSDYYFKGVGSPMENIPGDLTYTSWLHHDRSGPSACTLFLPGSGGNVQRTWLYVQSDSVSMAISDGTQQGNFSYTAYTSTNYPNDFNYVTTTCSDNGDGSSTIIIYVNGKEVTQKTDVGVVSGRVSGPNEPDFARGGSSGGQRFSGKIASASIYNRCLSADEVKRNFDAMRGRFGL
jgi:hypothetical protein